MLLTVNLVQQRKRINKSETNVNVSKDSQRCPDKKVQHYMVSTVKQTLTILQILFHNLLIHTGITYRIMGVLMHIHEMRKKYSDEYKPSDYYKVHSDYFENQEADIKNKKLKIDGKELDLEPIDNGKDWKIDGKIIPKIDIDNKEIWTVDINAGVSSIYYLFGSNKYKDAGEAAQRLLEDIKKGYALLKKINE